MDRKQLIRKIEELRESRVITYLTSDRQGAPGVPSAKIAMDIVPVISKQLGAIGKTKNIDLFLYSSGGDTMVPWRLVSMIREYCDKFSVIAPYKAHSAATMIALSGRDCNERPFRTFADRSFNRKHIQSSRPAKSAKQDSHFS